MIVIKFPVDGDWYLMLGVILEVARSDPDPETRRQLELALERWGSVEEDDWREFIPTDDEEG